MVHSKASRTMGCTLLVFPDSLTSWFPKFPNFWHLCNPLTVETAGPLRSLLSAVSQGGPPSRSQVKGCVCCPSSGYFRRAWCRFINKTIVVMNAITWIVERVINPENVLNKRNALTYQNVNTIRQKIITTRKKLSHNILKMVQLRSTYWVL